MFYLQKKTPVVGETYYIHSNEYYTMNIKEGMVEVVSVGRKYFTVKSLDTDQVYKFFKENFIQYNGEYTPEVEIYNDKDEYEKYIKAKNYKKELETSLLQYLTMDETISLYEMLEMRKR